MRTLKLTLVFSFFLIIALSLISAWLYLKGEDLAAKISVLENELNILTAKHRDLQNQISTLSSIFSADSEQLNFENLKWQANNANVTLTVRNTGTSTIVLVALFINDAIAEMTISSNLLSPGQATTLITTISGGFTSGVKYEFTLITASGKQYKYVTTAP
jgi:hypothetical protein